MLEVETGRCNQTAHSERYCQRCRKALLVDVVGDQMHALTQCLRGERARYFLAKFRPIFAGTKALERAGINIFTMVRSHHFLAKNLQKDFWRGLASVTRAVGDDTQTGRDMQDNAPDMWTARL